MSENEVESVATKLNPPPLTRPWKVRERELDSSLKTLQVDTGLHPLMLTLCMQRGLKTREEIISYLQPRLDQLTDPFKIRDMDKAIHRIAFARESGEPLLIFGDYDVDGTTGAALLSWGFREMGVKSTATQPDRFKDGYGLNVAAVEQAHADGVRLMVTVDCGISSFDAAIRAKELGIDLIVVDHHQIDALKGLPAALAIVNPQRADCPSELKQLCGCGLGFYLLMALRTEGRRRGWWSAERGETEPNLKRHLDLVVLATAADMVPLTGDNHILVRHGLEVLKNSTKPGVRALLEAANLNPASLSPSHLGFTIGPRINASGRMGSASLALELLTTEDAARAYELAHKLESINKERAEVQNQIWDQVKLKVEQGIAAGRYQHAIVIADAEWHEGVVGIVASRVTETFHRPAIVLSIRADHVKGSARTFAGKDVLEALRRSSRFLKGFGGHRHAAGVSLDESNLEEFTAAFDHAISELQEDREARPIWIDAECELWDLTLPVLQQIERLGPFGTGNPEPVFKLQAQVSSHRILKERHLKMTLTQSQMTASDRAQSSWDAIWFHAVEKLDEESDAWLKRRDPQEWIVNAEINRFRGAETPSLRIKDRRAANII